MSVALLMKIPASDDEYRSVSDDALSGGPPPGLLMHVGGKEDGSGSRWVVQVWESFDQHERFTREHLIPALERNGVATGGGPPEMTRIEVDHLAGLSVPAS